MIEKNKILESWIMVEHLSEGDFKQDKSMIPFSEKMQNDDFYTFFKGKLDGQKSASKSKRGLAVYIEIFDFIEIVNILREKFSLDESFQDIRLGQKFSLVIYFNSKLEFLADKTFFTESAYIRINKSIPSELEFHTFETALRQELASKFNETAENITAFNEAMKFTTEKYSAALKNCKIKILNNVDTEAVNLHSFFIDDLEKAKKIDLNILHDYLYGNIDGRVNLDSKSDSPNFNPCVFESILQPENYPSGRFPGNTKFALSLMQQTAVNACISDGSKPIKSVNGPPGTGKTTLLKDIFAELIVRQAKDITELSGRTINGSSETKYSEYASIGEIPDFITENNIVVASSNNGAVQNIVNELPLITAIDEDLIEELKSADYFRELSNSKLKIEFEKDEMGENQRKFVAEPNEGEEKYWGLFSLEGGKSENMTNIVTSVQHIAKYLNEEYEADFGIYKTFTEQYKLLAQLKSRARQLSDLYADCTEKSRLLDSKKNAFAAEKAEKEKNLSEQLAILEGTASQHSLEKAQAEKELNEILSEKSKADAEISQLECFCETLKSNKPSFFSGRDKKKNYRQQVDGIMEKLSVLMSEKTDCRNSEDKLKLQISTAEKYGDDCRNKIQCLKDEFDRWEADKGTELAELEAAVANQLQILQENNVNPLDMSRDYEELQLSNPWFDREFRRQQSRLFITALKVRKQFLYENVKNLNAAAFVWNKQDKHLSNKRLIAAAWNWINMAIPVISSTFASFSNMCRNLEPETLGYLFVDEAGQALPQAAVGAVFRSRHLTVVGDPSQIQPVLTLDSNILDMMGRYYGVNEKYLSDSASVQTLSDAASSYGYYRDEEKSESSWIGIPLWVHRRCMYPMFSISNKISYGGLMVQADKRFGKTGWFDVKGQANDKYVEEQGEFLCAKLSKMIKENPKINDHDEKDIVYIITPFSNVAYKLSQKLNKIGFTRYEKGKPTNIGTIHTFQGKEAPIVFMVLGADNQSKGSAKWAVSAPNMMNVAATRAKKEFYIIGDKKLYLGLNCDVITDTYEIIAEYGKEHPEQFDCDVSFMSDYNADRAQNTSAVTQKAAPIKVRAAVPAVGRAPDNRLAGTVSYLGKKKNSSYAYIKGNDGKSYTVTESVFGSFPPDIQTAVRKGAKVIFTAAENYVKEIISAG